MTNWLRAWWLRGKARRRFHFDGMAIGVLTAEARRTGTDLRITRTPNGVWALMVSDQHAFGTSFLEAADAGLELLMLDEHYPGWDEVADDA